MNKKTSGTLVALISLFLIVAAALVAVELYRGRSATGSTLIDGPGNLKQTEENTSYAGTGSYWPPETDNTQDWRPEGELDAEDGERLTSEETVEE